MTDYDFGCIPVEDTCPAYTASPYDGQLYGTTAAWQCQTEYNLKPEACAYTMRADPDYQPAPIVTPALRSQCTASQRDMGTEDDSSRFLTLADDVTQGGRSETVCAQFCASAGYSYMGLQWKNKCF